MRLFRTIIAGVVIGVVIVAVIQCTAPASPQPVPDLDEREVSIGRLVTEWDYKLEGTLYVTNNGGSGWIKIQLIKIDLQEQKEVLWDKRIYLRGGESQRLLLNDKIGGGPALPLNLKTIYFWAEADDPGWRIWEYFTPIEEFPYKIYGLDLRIIGFVAGFIVPNLLVLLRASQRLRRERLARIKEYRAKVEQWKSEGYDISELEGMLK